MFHRRAGRGSAAASWSCASACRGTWWRAPCGGRCRGPTGPAAGGIYSQVMGEYSPLHACSPACWPCGWTPGPRSGSPSDSRTWTWPTGPMRGEYCGHLPAVRQSELTWRLRWERVMFRLDLAFSLPTRAYLSASVPRCTSGGFRWRAFSTLTGVWQFWHRCYYLHYSEKASTSTFG